MVHTMCQQRKMRLVRVFRNPYPLENVLWWNTIRIFLFQFCDMQNLANFFKNLGKLVEFTLVKKFFQIFLSEKDKIQKKITGCNTVTSC